MTLLMREWLSGRASPCQGERREFESRLPLHFRVKRRVLRLLICKKQILSCGFPQLDISYIFRRHSQVVRHRSATPLFPGSNPGDASKNPYTAVCGFLFVTIDKTA